MISESLKTNSTLTKLELGRNENWNVVGVNNMLQIVGIYYLKEV